MRGRALKCKGELTAVGGFMCGTLTAICSHFKLGNPTVRAPLRRYTETVGDVAIDDQN